MAAGGSQGVTQVSVLGQCGALLLPQLLRRLRTHSEHESSFTLNEDVLARGFAKQAGAQVRDEDTLRVRHLVSDDRDEWSLNVLSRPLPIRENPEVLIRNIAAMPLIEGEARALAVALGYAERKFSYSRKGHRFSLAGGLTIVEVYQVYQTQEAKDPVDTTNYVVEATSFTSLDSSASGQQGALPMQALRDQAVQRTVDVKRVLKGLVDLSRVE